MLLRLRGVIVYLRVKCGVAHSKYHHTFFSYCSLCIVYIVKRQKIFAFIRSRIVPTRMITLTPLQLHQLVVLRGDVASAWLSQLGGYSEFANGLGTSVTEGIQGTQEDLENRRRIFGTNKVTLPKIPSFCQLLTKSAKDITLLILLLTVIITAVISVIDIINSSLYERSLLGDKRWTHPWADEIGVMTGILFIILSSAMMDYIKYSHITWLLDVIEKIHRVRVIRGGKESILSTAEVVVGDLCLLKMGDVIPADGVVIESYDLKIEDNRISGDIPCMQKGPTDPIVNAGTVVIEGIGRMIVASVGTPLHGHVSPYGNLKGAWRKKYIFQKLMEIDKKKEKLLSYTDLQNKVFRFSTELTLLGVFMAFLILVVLMAQTLIHIYLFNNQWTIHDVLHSTESIATAIIALAIMVPKSLPLIPTLSLAYSLKEMVNNKVLLHHFDTYETMGNVSVICTDKTGSLTIDRLQVIKSHICDTLYLSTPPFHNLPDPVGNIITHNISINTSYSSRLLLPIRYGSPILYDGDHTDCALLQFVQDLGRSYEAIRFAYPSDSLTRIYHFNTERRYMMTVVPRKAGGYRLFVKGAPEVVLKRCHFYCGYGGRLIEFNSQSMKKYLKEVVDPMAEEGLRVVAIAYRDFVQNYAKINQSFVLEQPDWEKEENIFSSLTLLAVMGIADPMRPEVPAAVARCRMAGIFVCLLTGESMKAAKFIATQCGILKKRSDKIMDTIEFNQSIRDTSGEVRQALLDSLWPFVRVIARCSSMDKYHIVLGITNSLNAGESQVAAVLGDGLGDIPALEQSDVAFSKNINAAGVAKEISDTIVLNDSFETVTKALQWSNNLHENVCRFLQFYLEASAVTIIFTFLTCCALEESSLKVIHLMWISVIIDIFAVASLLAECPDPSEPLIQRNPLYTCHPLVSQIVVKNIFGQAFFQLPILFYLLFQGDLFLGIETGIHLKDPSQHSTIVFNTLIMMILFSKIKARKIYGERNIFSNILNNRVFFLVWHLCFAAQVLIVQFGKAVCCTTALDFDQWLWSVFFGMGVLVWAQFITTLPTRCVIPSTLFTYCADTPLTDKEWNAFQSTLWIRGPARTRTEIEVLRETDGTLRHGKVYSDKWQKM